MQNRALQNGILNSYELLLFLNPHAFLFCFLGWQKNNQHIYGLLKEDAQGM